MSQPNCADTRNKCNGCNELFKMMEIGKCTGVQGRKDIICKKCIRIRDWYKEDSIIAKSKKIKVLELTSVYVGLSRVQDYL